MPQLVIVTVLLLVSQSWSLPVLHNHQTRSSKLSHPDPVSLEPELSSLPGDFVQLLERYVHDQKVLRASAARAANAASSAQTEADADVRGGGNAAQRMLGDQPVVVENAIDMLADFGTNPNAISADNLTALSQYLTEMRNRAKDYWIRVLKQNVLMQVGRSNVTVLQNASNPITTFITEKIRSFYPQCDWPKGTDSDLWNDSKTMNLHFNVIDLDDSIQSATLRLYRIRNESNPNCDDDEIVLRVSAYWYLKPLKKQKTMRRRLCDSKVVPQDANWIELNVKAAATTWTRGNNAGLAIVVEDQDGNMLRTTQYFNGQDCGTGGPATPKPIPSFILDSLRQPYQPVASPPPARGPIPTAPTSGPGGSTNLLGRDAQLVFYAQQNAVRIPTLDIKTSDHQNAQHALMQHDDNATMQHDATDDRGASDEDCPDDRHGHRHQHGHHGGHHHGGTTAMPAVHNTRHHHHLGAQQPQQQEVETDPRSRMIATKIVWTNQQFLDWQKQVDDQNQRRMFGGI